MSDPWDGAPASSGPSSSNRMRCDPKQPLPRLEPQALLALGASIATAARKMIDPAVGFVESVAAAAEREKQELLQRADRMARERLEWKRIENAKNGWGPDGEPRPSMGAPNLVENPPLARERIELLRAQLHNAQTVGDKDAYLRISQELAWLQYNLQMSEPTSGHGSGNSTGGGTPAVPTEGTDRPRTDGLHGETQGGAPLAPPPENTAPAPRRRPMPGPDSGPAKGPDLGPYRTYRPPVRGR
jgi:hypothetical protein